MTITLSWWWIPVALILIGAFIFFTAKPTGDYDFVTPIIGAIVGVAFVAAAAAFMLGRWLA